MNLIVTSTLTNIDLLSTDACIAVSVALYGECHTASMTGLMIILKRLNAGLK